MSVKEITDMSKKGVLRRMSMIEPVCPPKHTNADAFALVNPETVGAKNIAFFCVEIHPGGAAEEDTHPNIEHGYFLISGKGRCNLTNTCDIRDFLEKFSKTRNFLRNSFAKFFNTHLSMKSCQTFLCLFHTELLPRKKTALTLLQPEDSCHCSLLYIPQNEEIQ